MSEIFATPDLRYDEFGDYCAEYGAFVCDEYVMEVFDMEEIEDLPLKCRFLVSKEYFDDSRLIYIPTDRYRYREMREWVKENNINVGDAVYVKMEVL